MDKDSKVVLLTGGSSGIGAETARILSGSGMRVYALSRRGTAPESVPPGVIVPLHADVTDPGSLSAAVSKILEAEGRIDAAVCNAGSGMAGAVEETSPEEVDYQFGSTFMGTVNTVRACLPPMRKQGKGRIITVSSFAAIVPIPYQGYYAAAKSAVLSLTKTLSLETRAFGIECCSILPGDVRTGFTSARKFSKESSSPTSPYRSKMEKGVGKMEKDEMNGMPPEKIAKAILRQLERKRMKPEVIPGLEYKLLGLLVRILPEGIVMKVLGKMYSA